MTRSQKLLAAFFSFAGIMHFVRPHSYEAIVPPWVPMHREVVIVSGVAEIAGAAMIVYPPTRRFARWWLLALLVAVFPANVYMAVSPEKFSDIPPWALWARLPLQPLAMLWVVRATEDAK